MNTVSVKFRETSKTFKCIWCKCKQQRSTEKKILETKHLVSNLGLRVSEMLRISIAVTYFPLSKQKRMLRLNFRTEKNAHYKQKYNNAYYLRIVTFPYTLQNTTKTISQHRKDLTEKITEKIYLTLTTQNNARMGQHIFCKQALKKGKRI